MISRIFRIQSSSEIGRKLQTAVLLLRTLAISLIVSAFQLAPEALAAPALVQNTTSEALGSTTITGTYSSQPGSGNLLLAIVGNRNSVTIDSTSAGWQTAINQSANAPGQAIFYRIAGASEPTSFAVYYGATATRLGLRLLEYSGVDQALPFHTTNSSSGTGVSASSGSVTTTVTDQLVVAGLVVNDATQCSTWTNSFVERHDFQNSGAADTASTFGTADIIASTASSYSTTATLEGGGTPSWRGQIVSFYPDGTLSVSVNNSTFSFGTQLANTWLTPDSSLIINDGQLAEDFTGQITQFTDGGNDWTISAASNGSDQIRGQWSATSGTGPWTDIAAYDLDFAVATNVAVDDTVTMWFRVQTPTSTNSYSAHSSNLTVTATAN